MRWPLLPPTLSDFQNSTAWLLILGVWLTYLLAVGVYRSYFHSLARFRGPRTAVVNELYEAYYDLAISSQYVFLINCFPGKYGQIGM